MLRNVSVTIRGDQFAVATPFALNQLAKNMPNRTWNRAHKVWLGPVNKANCAYLIMAVNEPDRWSEDAKIAAHDKLNERVQDFRFPILHDFGKYEPRDKKQWDALDAAYGKKAVALFIIMGKGKTYISIQLALRYYAEQQITKVLVVCPVSIRESAWVQGGWNKFASHFPVQTTICPKKPTNSGMRVMIVGTESLSTGSAYDYADRFVDDRTMVIIDESSKIKNHKAKRTEKIQALAHKGKYRIIMTGTSITQGIHDLYSQFAALDPDIIGHKSFYTFRNRYCVMGGYQGRNITGYQNVEELMDAVRPYVFQDTDKSDLPKKIYMPERRVMITAEQRGIIKELKDQMKVELDGQKLTIQNALGWMVRAQQIVGGNYPYLSVDGNWKTRPLAKNPKLDELMEILNEQADGVKTIVWSRFRPEISAIHEKVESAGIVCGQLHGGISSEDRARIVSEFQDGRIQVLVANQATGGMGLTLTAATNIVYYSNTFSYEDRVQSEDRAHRIGQHNPVTYTNILCDANIDRTVMQCIAKKAGMAEFVNDAMEKGELI